MRRMFAVYYKTVINPISPLTVFKIKTTMKYIKFVDFMNKITCTVQRYAIFISIYYENV